MEMLFWVLPILIFLARVVDVSLGTMRIIFVSKNLKKLAPIVGFFEVFIWINVIGQVMQNVNSVIHYIAYAAGFAAGNYVGIVIEERLAVGHVIARIITKENTDNLIKFLKKEKCGVTVIDAKGKKGDVKILFTVIKRKKLDAIYEAIDKFTPDSFVSVEDVKSVSEDSFVGVPLKKKKFLGTFRALRKGK
ncbi:MAG TPA: DUF2179 domain-containing protein [Methanofastidiosum sp.]|nr:DUF2179 domain-containing protein [Methanofastidiosum sp.]HNU62235.1 DUF2179 domain-containing protein [Methanofastidiosum sp.]